MSIVFSLKITGLDDLEDNLQTAGDKIRKEVSGELGRFGEEVMADSKMVVPVLTGTLRETGHVDPPVDEGAKISMTIGYGGPAAPYALFVHEELQGAVPPSPNWSWTKKVARGGQIQWTSAGTGPKYLENPLKAKQDQLSGRIRDAVLRALKK